MNTRSTSTTLRTEDDGSIASHTRSRNPTTTSLNRSSTTTGETEIRNYKSLKNLEKGIWKRKFDSFKLPTRVQGKMLTSLEIKFILRLYYGCKLQEEFNSTTDSQIIQFIAKILCCSDKTIKDLIKSDGERSEDKRGHPMEKVIPNTIAPEMKNAAISQIKESLSNGKPIFTSDIRQLIYEKGIDITKKTLLKYFIEWDISWEQVKYEEARKSRDYVLFERYNFLNEYFEEMDIPQRSCKHIMKCKCIKRREVVYIDQSYVYQNHTSKYSLNVENLPLLKPSGKGKRIVMVGTITESGWLGISENFETNLGEGVENSYEDGAIKYWVSQIGNKDYHVNFNRDIFIDYFQNYVLRNLKRPSLIILDRAKYHRTFPKDTFFPLKAKKADLKEWLKKFDVLYKVNALKKDLQEIALEYWDPPETEIEILAKEDGIRRFNYPHRVLYLPPYHPEYNPIEMGWSIVKGEIAKRPKYNLALLLKEELPKAFAKVTAELCKKMYSHSLKIMKKHYNDKNIIDDLDERLPIEEQDESSDEDLYMPQE